jgi:hypothetical protein
MRFTHKKRNYKLELLTALPDESPDEDKAAKRGRLKAAASVDIVEITCDKCGISQKKQHLNSRCALGACMLVTVA